MHDVTSPYAWLRSVYRHQVNQAVTKIEEMTHRIHLAQHVYAAPASSAHPQLPGWPLQCASKFLYEVLKSTNLV